jgi:hypothetical protein
VTSRIWWGCEYQKLSSCWVAMKVESMRLFSMSDRWKVSVTGCENVVPSGKRRYAPPSPFGTVLVTRARWASLQQQALAGRCACIAITAR